MENDVFIAKTHGEYPKFPYDDHNHPMCRTLYDLFKAWGKNPDNPFEGLVNSGDVVVIKPNWVMDLNPLGYNLDCLITHSALIKYVIDWIAKALDSKGTIVVGDAPIQHCDFKKLIKASRIQEIVQLSRQEYPDIDFKLEDWRLTVMNKKNHLLELKSRADQICPEDYDTVVPDKYVLADLGENSFLEDICDYSTKFRVTNYKNSLMLAHHKPGKHEYLVTRRIQQAQLIVNLPKMKTHMKAGLTGALKNLIGINGHKEFLPHHIRGSYFSGGDGYNRSHFLRSIHDRLYDRIWEKFADTSSLGRIFGLRVLDVLWWLARLSGSDCISAGSWSGNETLWRTTLDLNHIVYFSKYSSAPVLTIVDGIVAGEGNGPLRPMPKGIGMIIAGENPACIDTIMAKIMGYNISRIPTIYNAIYHRRSEFGGVFLRDLRIVSLMNKAKSETVCFDDLPNLNFKKPRHWRRADVMSKS